MKMTSVRVSLALAAAFVAMTTGATAQDSGDRSDRPVRISRGLLHEGAFLADQPGRLIKLEQGGSAFVFDRNAEGRATPPMAVLPCTTLMRMEQIRDAREGEVRFRVSGQVFVYDGRNYLLPTFYRVQGADEAPAPVENLADDPATEADPSVEELIEALEELTPIARSEEDELTLPSTDLLSDSSFLKPRRGRIVRSVSGSPAFAINNDADAPTEPETPMPILPSRSLTMIERLLEEHGAESAFILSGRVFLYRGQNYLMPSMVQLQLDRSSGLTSAQ